MQQKVWDNIWDPTFLLHRGKIFDPNKILNCQRNGILFWPNLDPPWSKKADNIFLLHRWTIFDPNKIGFVDAT